jgi:Protein of unknown function (DUF1579)
MKRMAIALSLAVLVFAVSIWAQTAPPKPDPELKKFEVFVGHWTYEGEYKAGPLGSGSKVTGELTIKPILGGFFFRNQGAEKGPMGEMEFMEIVGYDPVKKNIASNEYHDDGIMLSGAYAFNGNTCTYAGKFIVGGKTYMVKNVLILAADMMSLTAKGDISTDGNAWTPWLEAKYTKTKPAPKK